MKIYLAGPDVFYPDAVNIGIMKKQLCQNHGAIGLYPLDNELTGEDDLGYRIFLANKNLMDEADCCIANLSPFRGPSADVGTVAELGYMIGLGKPVFAFSRDPRPYIERVGDSYVFGLKKARYDRFGHTIEDFGLHDNLMIDGFIRYQGFEIIVPVNGGETDLSLFTRCIKSCVDNMNFRKRMV